MNASTIQFSVEAGIGIITLNRPEKRNAITDDMRSELIDALEQATRDKTVRAVVLTGNGKGFCAGGDISGMAERMEAPAGDVAFNGWSRQQRVHHCVNLLYSMPKPTIAAISRCWLWRMILIIRSVPMLPEPMIAALSFSEAM